MISFSSNAASVDRIGEPKVGKNYYQEVAPCSEERGQRRDVWCCGQPEAQTRDNDLRSVHCDEGG